MGDTRVVEEGREDLRSKEHISHIYWQTLLWLWGFSGLHLPCRALTQGCRWRWACPSVTWNKARKFTFFTDEKRRSQKSSLQPAWSDIYRNDFRVAVNMAKFHLLPLISDCIPGQWFEIAFELERDDLVSLLAWSNSTTLLIFSKHESTFSGVENPGQCRGIWTRLILPEYGWGAAQGKFQFFSYQTDPETWKLEPQMISELNFWPSSELANSNQWNCV